MTADTPREWCLKRNICAYLLKMISTTTAPLHRWCGCGAAGAYNKNEEEKLSSFIPTNPENHFFPCFLIGLNDLIKLGAGRTTANFEPSNGKSIDRNLWLPISYYIFLFILKIVFCVYVAAGSHKSHVESLTWMAVLHTLSGQANSKRAKFFLVLCAVIYPSLVCDVT